MTRRMSVWTIYDHPTDYPDGYIARRWELAEEPLWTADVMHAATLDEIRQRLVMRGLVAITRSRRDDESIVETWL